MFEPQSTQTSSYFSQSIRIKLTNIFFTLLIKFAGIIFVLSIKVLVGVFLALALKKLCTGDRNSKYYPHFINNSIDKYCPYTIIESQKNGLANSRVYSS